MTLSFNKVILVGRLTHDPKYYSNTEGKEKVIIRIAVNRDWDNNEGEKEGETLFINCEAWGDRAIKINKWFKIGRPILVEGYLAYQKEWTNKEGKIIREMMVKIKNWEFMDNKGKNENNNEIPESAGNCETEETTPEDFDSLVEKVVSE